MAFENDVAAAASVLNVFSRNTAQQQLLENSVLKSIVDSIGGSPVLYNTAVGYILERYIATGHPRLASLRLHLLQYHLQPSQQSTPSGRQVLRPSLVAHTCLPCGLPRIGWPLGAACAVPRTAWVCWMLPVTVVRVPSR